MQSLNRSARLSLRALSFLLFATWSLSALANEASENRAGGLEVDLRATLLVLGLDVLDIGPLPETQASGSAAYNASDQYLGLNVSSPLNLLSAGAGVLVTDVEFDGHGPGLSASGAGVEGLNVGVSILGLLGLNLGAGSVIGEANITGRCGTLQAVGNTTLVDAGLSISGAGVIDLPVNPLPNTQIDVLGLLGVAGITLILNEQIISGDGVTHLSMRTNAIRLNINLSVPLVGGITGSVVVSQAEATRNCNVADLSVSKSASPDPATQGMPLTYTVGASNNGPETARDARLVDYLPDSAQFVSAGATQGHCAVQGGIVTCDVGDIASGANASAEIVVVPQVSGVILNRAEAVSVDLDPNPDNAIIEIETQVNPPSAGEADLVLTKTAMPMAGLVGKPMDFNFTLVNQGPDNATGVTLTDQVPAGFQITGTSATDGGQCGMSGQIVTCAWHSVPPGLQVAAAINTIPQAAGTFTNQAIAIADQIDPVPASASSSVQVTVNGEDQADLTLAKTASASTVIAGLPFSYGLVVTNIGPDDAQGVVLTDTLPAGISLQSASASGGGSCSSSGQTVTCQWNTVALFQVVNATFNVIATQTGTRVNHAQVESATLDPAPGNNTASATVQVQAPAAQADLRLSKVASPSTVNVGQNTTFTITATNDGPNPATAVNLTDVMPEGLVVTAVQASGSGQCDFTTVAAVCTFASLSAGSSASMTVTAEAVSVGTFLNKAVVNSAVADPNPGNNTASAEVHAESLGLPEAELVLVKEAVPHEVLLGQPILFRFTLTNNGPEASTRVRIRDFLPSAAPPVTANAYSNGHCTVGGLQVTCEWPHIGVGETVEAVVVARAEAVGTFTNGAIASSPDTENPCGACAQSNVEFTITAESAGACQLHQATRNTSETAPRHVLNNGGGTLLFTSNENPSGDNAARLRALYRWSVLDHQLDRRLTAPNPDLELLSSSRDIQRTLIASSRHPATGASSSRTLWRLDDRAGTVSALGSAPPGQHRAASDNYGRNPVILEAGELVRLPVNGDRVTFTPAGVETGSIEDLYLSGNGRFATFSAVPADGTLRQVYRLSLDSDSTVQLTAGDQPSRPTAISSTGDVIAVLSSAALTPNAQAELAQAYTIDLDNQVRRVSPGGMAVLHLGLGHNGNRAVLGHAGEDQAYTLSLVDLTETSLRAERLFEFPGETAMHIELVANNQSGTVISVNSNLDLLGLNPGERPQAYVVDCFEPRLGLWSNAERSGHGMELNLNRQNTLFKYWATYDAAGMPRWYYMVGELAGRSWEGKVYTARMSANRDVTVSEVGRIWAGFRNSQSMLVTWEIDGEKSGFEPFEFREFAVGPPERDFSGHLRIQEQSGWGISHVSMREANVATLLYYDGEGRPTWAQGGGENGAYELFSIRGTNLCPGCEGPTSFNSLPAGSLFIDFDDLVSGTVLLEADAPDNSVFAREGNARSLARPAP